MAAAVFFEAELLNATIAFGGLLVLLAVTMGALLLSYVADEEAKRRPIKWFEEPLAIADKPVPAEVIPLRRAA